MGLHDLWMLRYGNKVKGALGLEERGRTFERWGGGH
jgi:hypothetical protein